MICKTDERIYKVAIWAQCFKRRDISLHPDFPIDEVLWIFYSFVFAWLTSTPEHLCSLSTQKGLSLCVPWKAFSLPTAASFIKIKEIREEKLKKMLFTLTLPNHFSSEYEFFISSTSKCLWVPMCEKCCGDDAKKTEITTHYHHIILSSAVTNEGRYQAGDWEGETWRSFLLLMSSVCLTHLRKCIFIL